MTNICQTYPLNIHYLVVVVRERVDCLEATGASLTSTGTFVPTSSEIDSLGRQ
jgi:hypothetical protein